MGGGAELVSEWRDQNTPGDVHFLKSVFQFQLKTVPTMTKFDYGVTTILFSLI